MRLGDLKKGNQAFITRVASSDEALLLRLLEMGLLEGTPIEIAHEAPFGKDPIAVRVRGTLIALRRSEADQIEVRLDE